MQLPGSNQGYEPVQPIAYSHRLHAGELQIDCLYCHFGAEQTKAAGVPPVNVCMNCHSFITAPYNVIRHEDEQATKEGRKAEQIVSAELARLFTYRDSSMSTAIGTGSSIPWVRIHALPDFVYFNHSAHVHAEIECQKCHGEVQTMERVRQVEDLTMGWCVNCHREFDGKPIQTRTLTPPTDCVGCHY
ncbi:MAG: cytochrome C [Ectothiorhodospiraceae bacterium]|nr:cytochrome C [Ectothiorhodospiraceae bacterium]